MELLSIPAVIVIVEALKRMGLSGRWVPVMALVVGIVLGFFFGEGEIIARVGIGLIFGLSASGVYSQAKKVYGG